MLHYAPPSFESLLRTGNAALSRGAWEQARADFEAALRQNETPEALESLGMAAWWLDDPPTVFESRERAYRLYREQGDARAAGRVAAWIAWDYSVYRGEPAVAAGWFARAHHLLDGLAPCPEHGWLAEREGGFLLRQDKAAAARLAAEAAALGRALGLCDLEVGGLALEGLALVSAGAVEQGMRRLDDAAAAIVAGEVTDITTMGMSCCNLIRACELVRDYDRAAQWCLRLQEFCRRWDVGPLYAICRTYYATVLIWRGAWAEAETELQTALRTMNPARPGTARGVTGLAEVRRRQGRWDEAAALFARAGAYLPALLGSAALACDQGDPATAFDLLDLYLRRLPADSQAERAAGLELLVQAQLASGDPAQARQTLAEFQASAASLDTPGLRSAAAFAEGLVAAAESELDVARKRFEDARDLYEACSAPFELGQTRRELARVLLALRRPAAAAASARAALAAFRQLGAAVEATRTEALLAQIEAGNQTSTPAADGLTPRERDVLRLVAQGLHNPDIAKKLGLSDHTVHRHLANILRKLCLPSRAAAAAHAARLGLL